MRQLKITQSITNRDDRVFEKYLSDISRIEMISVEEETILSRKIKEGDQEALDKLVRANLRFVVSVAKQYQNHGMPLMDIVNEGNIGLIKAAKKFDETRGFKFISYAVWWIRQSILDSLSEKSRIIRMPLNQITLLGKINKAVSELEQELERYPTSDEIAEALDTPDHKIDQVLITSLKHSSLDSPLGGDSESSNMIEVLYNKEESPTDNNLILDSLKIEINRSLSILDERTRSVIKMFYGIDQTCPRSLEEIGKKLDLSNERVRQIRERGIKKLKASSKRNILRSYM